MHERVIADIQAIQPFFQSLVPDHQQWCIDVDVACWLRSYVNLPRADVALVLNYRDDTGSHTVRVDIAEVDYFDEALLTSRLKMKGAGRLEYARLELQSRHDCDLFQALNICFNVPNKRALLSRVA